MKIENILVAIDTSNEANKVLESALELGHKFNASLSIIHVVEPVVTENSYDLITALPMEMDELLHKRADDFLKKLQQKFAPEAACTIETGSVKTEVLRYASDHNIDLIVVGSHGRHGLALLLGSTANALLHGAPCDVYVVRIEDNA